MKVLSQEILESLVPNAIRDIKQAQNGKTPWNKKVSDSIGILKTCVVALAAENGREIARVMAEKHIERVVTPTIPSRQPRALKPAKRA